MYQKRQLEKGEINQMVIYINNAHLSEFSLSSNVFRLRKKNQKILRP